MPATSQVASWRALPGKAGTFLGQVSQAKAIHERLGATVNIAQTVVGGEPMTLIYMMTFDSGAAHGAFMDALSGDSDWQKFWDDAMANPTAELVSTGLYTAIEGL